MLGRAPPAADQRHHEGGLHDPVQAPDAGNTTTTTSNNKDNTIITINNNYDDDYHHFMIQFRRLTQAPLCEPTQALYYIMLFHTDGVI